MARSPTPHKTDVPLGALKPVATVNLDRHLVAAREWIRHRAAEADHRQSTVVQSTVVRADVEQGVAR